MKEKSNAAADKPVFIIAEVSVNHGQDFNRAAALIKKAKSCGADAVKFQTYTPDTITLDVNNKYFKINHPKWGGQTLYQLYKKSYAPWRWFKKLKRIADDIGIIFFSTVFDKTSVDLLEEINVPMHKISSFELVDLPLIEYAARTKKPLILSTGMADVSEIKEAVDTAKGAGAKEITLLKCVSSYPASPQDMNLKAIPALKKKFNCLVGLSDHTLGTAVAIAAVSLGASVVEKHFTLSRSIKTPDNFFSIEPQELKAMADDIRIVEKAVGMINYGLSTQEKDSRWFRRSLFAVKDIARGETLTEENVKSIRPAYGLAPKYLKDVLNRKAKRHIKKGTPLDWDLF